MENLKPCPFCGGEVTMAYSGSSDWDVTCRGSCPVTTHFWVSAKKHGYGEGENAEAVKRWNTRVPEGRITEEQIKKAADLLRANQDARKCLTWMWNNADTDAVQKAFFRDFIVHAEAAIEAAKHAGGPQKQESKP